jgi:hypothetical protein
MLFLVRKYLVVFHLLRRYNLENFATPLEKMPALARMSTSLRKTTVARLLSEAAILGLWAIFTAVLLYLHQGSFEQNRSIGIMEDNF